MSVGCVSSTPPFVVMLDREAQHLDVPGEALVEILDGQGCLQRLPRVAAQKSSSCVSRVDGTILDCHPDLSRRRFGIYLEIDGVGTRRGPVARKIGPHLAPTVNDGLWEWA